MRALAIGVLSLALVFVVARWVLTRRPHWISVSLVLLLLVPLGVLEWRWRQADRAFSAATRWLAPSSEGSSCQRFFSTFTVAHGEWGYVAYGADGRPDTVALLSYEACRHLQDWYRSDKNTPTTEQAAAVHVIAHEAAHLNGEKNEAVAECFAVQRTADVAMRLGATRAQALALAGLYWREVYPRQLPTYRDAQCRDGGRLDRTPGDGRWP